MEASFINILLILLIVYAVAPTALIRFGRIGAVSCARKGGDRVAITFDDGPDPRYTPLILDILGRYKVNACFFVNGAKARAHPELIKKITLAGHEIGNHGFRHKAAWFLGPNATSKEIKETNRAIEELTGQQARFYRPAWGLFNMFSIWYYWLKGLKVVLWTYMSWDWSKHATPESITHNVLHRIRDGAILVLHDSDSTPGAAPGGPARVVAALPQILEGLRHRGLRVAPLHELVMDKSNKPTVKKTAQRLWSLIEKVIRKLAGIKDLGGGNTFIWRLALRRYHGTKWIMPDGTALCAGDFYIELHLNNERLLNLISENTSIERMAIIAMREVRNGLPELARLITNDEQFSKAKVLLGITILHRGTERMGFTAYDIKPCFFRTVTCWYEKMLLALFHPGGFKNLKSYRDNLSPRYVVITRQEIIRRYPPAGKTSTTHGQEG
ncbi:MAG: Peptidoglycan-N-acetylglucosamine deacetylase [Pelotomaculum sp. PtaU1.Bin035]|nr:MAG: Peptidoglycan-N-acetylglucosamine deacetylase [Pelotomaculum sp. PtaU1.Bin035]